MDAQRDATFWNEIEGNFSGLQSKDVAEIQKSDSPEKFQKLMDRYTQLLGGENVSLQTFRRIVMKGSSSEQQKGVEKQLSAISREVVGKETNRVMELFETDKTDEAIQELCQLSGLDVDIVKGELLEDEHETKIDKQKITAFLEDNLLSNYVLEQFINMQNAEGVKDLLDELPAGKTPQQEEDNWDTIKKNLEFLGNASDSMAEGVAESLNFTKLLHLVMAVDMPHSYGFGKNSSLFREGLEGKSDRMKSTLGMFEKLFQKKEVAEEFLKQLLRATNDNKDLKGANLTKEIHEFLSLAGVSSPEDKEKKVKIIKQKMIESLRKLKEKNMVDNTIDMNLENLNLSSEVIQYLLLQVKKLEESLS